MNNFYQMLQGLKPIMISSDLKCEIHHKKIICFQKNQENGNKFKGSCHECLDDFLIIKDGTIIFKKLIEEIKELQEQFYQNFVQNIQSNILLIEEILMNSLHAFRTQINGTLIKLECHIIEWVGHLIEVAKLQQFYCQNDHVSKILASQDKKEIITLTKEFFAKKKKNQMESIEMQNFMFQQKFQMDALKINKDTQSFLDHIQKYQFKQFNEFSIRLLANERSQQETCIASSFNWDGSIMAAGSLSDIKIWTMKEDPCHLEDPVLLFGQHGLILCMNFSKQVNWLVVGTSEGYIILWKEFSLKNWHSSHAIKGVSNKQDLKLILCLQFSSNEKELISSSTDNLIRVWNIKYETNTISFLYILNGHHSSVYSLSQDDSEMILATASHDKSIVIWERDEELIYKKVQRIIPSCGKYGIDICFLGNTRIVLQQLQPTMLHFFFKKEYKFIEQKDQMIDLEDTTDPLPSPLIFIRNLQTLIIKSKNKIQFVTTNRQSSKLHGSFLPCDGKIHTGCHRKNGNFYILWGQSTGSFQWVQLDFD